MAASDGTLGKGTTLSGSVTNAIGNITSLTLPTLTRDPVEITTMDSEDNWREFIPGLLNSGEVTFELNYDGSAAGNANVLNTALTAVEATWTITFPDGSKYVIDGFITSIGGAAPMDDKITQSVTIKFTGVPAYTDVAPE